MTGYHPGATVFSMEELAHFSPLINRSAIFLKQALEKVLCEIPGNVAREYLDSVKYVTETGSKSNSLHQIILLRYFLLSSFLQGIMEVDGNRVISFGAHIINEKTGNIRKSMVPFFDREDGEGLSQIERMITVQNADIRLTGIIPTVVRPKVSIILHEELETFLINHYGYRPDLYRAQPLDIWSPLEEHLIETIRRSYHLKSSVTITHIMFQRMGQYFEHMGEMRSYDTLKKIEMTINSNLMEDEVMIRICPLSYFVLTPGSSTEDVRRRFRKLVFYVDSLVLDFSIYHSAVTELPLRINDLWQRLHVRNYE